MTLIKKTAIKGRMELDRDDRHVEDGAYRYAMNMSVTRSESSDVGVVQSVFGNISRSHNFPFDASKITIGSVADSLNDRIYWFFIGSETEGIYEFDLRTNRSSRLLEFSRNLGILNFDVRSTVTGVNVIDNLLFWTDNNNEPRKINIDRFINSDIRNGVRGSLQLNPTVDINSNPISDNINSVIDITSADVNIDSVFNTEVISVAKRPPLFPPIISNVYNADNPFGVAGTPLFENFISFSYRHKFRDGETSVMSPFTNPAFFPENFEISRESGVLSSMVNRYRSVDLMLDVGSSEVTDIEILYKEANSGNVYVITSINKEDSNIIDHSTPYQRRYFSYTYENDKVYRLLPSDQLTRIYDNVPIRAKAQDFVGNRLVYGNYVENLSLNDETGSPVDVRFTVGLDSQEKEISDLSPSKSVKSGWVYELGIVYLNKNGIQTSVLVPQSSSQAVNNTILVPFENSGHKNRLNATISNKAPIDATHYRFFIKQTRGDFYNIAPLSVNKDSEFVYLRIPSLESENTFDENQNIASTINKVDKDDIVVLKSLDNSPEQDRREFRVVEDPSFINVSDRSDFTAASITEDGVYIILAPLVSGDLSYVPTGVSTGSVFETVPSPVDINLFYEHGQTFRCENGIHTASTEEIIRVDDDKQTVDDATGNVTDVTVSLDWFNTYSYSNGVESSHIRDEFFGPGIENGARASVIVDEYSQLERPSHLIHSGVYNINSNVNRLNEFNVSNPITTEIDRQDGAIQYLHERDTNLIAFQEDKIKRIPINKNLIQTAGGDSNLTVDSNFFGTEDSAAGEYGISTDPESFASYGNNIYFADRNRGAICRLGADGITEISRYGMENFFRRDTRVAEQIVAGYDEYFKRYLITLKNYGEPNLDPRDGTIVLSDVGCTDPRAESQRDVDLISFRTRYIRSDMSLTGSVNRGDVVFVDQERTIKFNGSFRFYRVSEGSGRNAITERIVQISPDGIITSIINVSDYGTVAAHREFNISSERFDDQFEACAGVIDTLAYFGCALDPNTLAPTSCTLPSDAEPAQDNILYEGAYDVVPSSRTGWYKISDGSNQSVINVVEGTVILKIDCDELELGRRAIRGSRPIINITTESVFNRNTRLCTANSNQATYYYEGGRDRPSVGDTLYVNNFNNTEAVASRFYVFDDGSYVLLNADSEVMSSGNCFDEICTNNPYEFFTQATSTTPEFVFTGIGASNDQPLPLYSTIEWYAVGRNRRYPETGSYTFTIEEPDFTSSGLADNTTLAASNFSIVDSDSTISELQETNIEYRLSRLCYREVNRSEGVRTIYRTPGSSTGQCGVGAPTALYYREEESPTVYYTQSSALAADIFDGQGMHYGIADEANGNAVQSIVIASNGTQTGSSVDCSIRFAHNLSYTPMTATNTATDSCLTIQCAFRGDMQNFSSASSGVATIVYDDNSGAIPPDGYYSDRTNTRLLTSGSFGNNLMNCASGGTFAAITARFSTESAICARYTATTSTIYTENNVLDASTQALYSGTINSETDLTRANHAAEGWYSYNNGTEDIVVEWRPSNKIRIGDAAYTFIGEVDPVSFTFDDLTVACSVSALGVIIATAEYDGTSFTVAHTPTSFGSVTVPTSRTISLTITGSIPECFENFGTSFTLTGDCVATQMTTDPFTLDMTNAIANLAIDETANWTYDVLAGTVVSTVSDVEVGTRVNANTQRNLTFIIRVPDEALYLNRNQVINFTLQATQPATVFTLSLTRSVRRTQNRLIGGTGTQADPFIIHYLGISDNPAGYLISGPETGRVGVSAVSGAAAGNTPTIIAGGILTNTRTTSFTPRNNAISLLVPPGAQYSTFGFDASSSGVDTDYQLVYSHLDDPSVTQTVYFTQQANPGGSGTLSLNESAFVPAVPSDRLANSTLFYHDGSFFNYLRNGQNVNVVDGTNITSIRIGVTSTLANTIYTTSSNQSWIHITPVEGSPGLFDITVDAVEEPLDFSPDNIYRARGGWAQVSFTSAVENRGALYITINQRISVYNGN